MLRFAADENLNYNIIRGLLRRKADLNIARIQDVGLSGKDDATVLEWTAKVNRILLTHDVTTITKYSYERINEGLPMPGVFEIKMNSPLGDIIDDILLLADYSYENEWEGKILYLPLKDKQWKPFSPDPRQPTKQEHVDLPSFFTIACFPILVPFKTAD